MNNVYLQATENDEDFGHRRWDAVIAFPHGEGMRVLTLDEFHNMAPGACLMGVRTDVKTIRSFIEMADRAYRSFWSDGTPEISGVLTNEA